mmetsp:Transcript_17076/g.22163  ORF Transcript_17076/g.22163 Transcript_17076/m.22163 type:complete len:212 (-) Transcript_17076:438-1073(-)
MSIPNGRADLTTSCILITIFPSSSSSLSSSLSSVLLSSSNCDPSPHSIQSLSVKIGDGSASLFLSLLLLTDARVLPGAGDDASALLLLSFSFTAFFLLDADDFFSTLSLSEDTFFFFLGLEPTEDPLAADEGFSNFLSLSCATPCLLIQSSLRALATLIFSSRRSRRCLLRSLRSLLNMISPSNRCSRHIVARCSIDAKNCSPAMLTTVST